MSEYKKDEALIGLAVAEKLLKTRYPRYAMSRHRLRRLCIARLIECTALPTGSQVRYLVRLSDIVRGLSAFAQTTPQTPPSH